MAVDLLECSRFRKIAIAELDRFFQSPIHYDGHYKAFSARSKAWMRVRRRASGVNYVEHVS